MIPPPRAIGSCWRGATWKSKDLAQDDLAYAVIQLQQAAEKACKGALIAHGWSLIKTHDLVFLIDELKNRGVAFDWFAEPAALLSREYFQERYVSWEAEPALTADEVRTLLLAVDRLFTALHIPSVAPEWRATASESN